MSDSQQPPFWLDVKKEYIIENFDKMLVYLEQYRYCEDADNGSFNETYECLKKFVYEILECTSGSNLCRVIPYENIDDRLLVRILITYLLVCYKIGTQDLHCLSMLANRMLLMNLVTTDEMTEKMRKLQFNCLRRRKVTKYAFSWNNIRDDASMSLSYIAFAVASTEFENDNNSASLYYENKGMLMITPDRMRLAPINYSDYRRNDIQTQFSVCDDIDICVDKKDREKIDSFDKLVSCNTSLMYQQKGVKPSPVKKLKTYDLKDETDIFVRVLSCNETTICAQTLDSDYEPLKGFVYVPNYIYSIDAGYLKQYLQKGMILKVRLQNIAGYPFRITEPLEDFYMDFAKDSYGNVVTAIFSHQYSAGLSWLTDNGLIVNIKNINDMEDANMAREYKTCIKVKVQDVKSIYDKVVVNGQYAFNSICDNEYESTLEFKEKAMAALIDEYLNRCEQEYIPNDDEDDDTESLSDASSILPLAYVMYKRAGNSYLSTIERYENLMAALMIAQLCDAEEDALFISHEMSFLSRLVSFAQGEEPKTLKLTHDIKLNDNKRVEYRERIVNVLSEYEQDTFLSNQMEMVDNDQILDNVNELVRASNILLHKINGQEINRIKKNITTVLGVGDMFRHNEDASTYYGEENDTLEFKSSAVYPPVNKRENQSVPAEPQRQKWEILKAVCGFLNSMSGGELLIGVLDNGYSCGVQPDIDYLYKNGKITEASMDRYKQYIKRFIDNAFRDDSGTAAEPRDITVSRVHCISETNKENNDILRIQVQPYEYGVIEFADKENVPEDMAAAYLRSSNTTQPLSKEMKDHLENAKLSERADAETQKILSLQTARKKHCAVILKGYNSKNGTKDRHVEAYKILLARNAVIGYDIEKKELREFKLTRFKEVVLTKRIWNKFNSKYNNLRVDLFGMLEGDMPETEIILKLANLPYNLMLEEFSGAADHITENKDADNDKYPWILSVKVFGMYGIGRFYIGLANHIKIVKGEELKEYVREYIKDIEP